MNKAIQDIAAERKRQIEVEGWNFEHDDNHARGEMARAAATYALGASYLDWDREKRGALGEWWGLRQSAVRELWPWEWHWFKPKDKRRDLIRAGALIVAEIERLDRALSSDEHRENPSNVGEK